MKLRYVLGVAFPLLFSLSGCPESEPAEIKAARLEGRISEMQDRQHDWSTLQQTVDKIAVASEEQQKVMVGLQESVSGLTHNLTRNVQEEVKVITVKAVDSNTISLEAELAKNQSFFTINVPLDASLDVGKDSAFSIPVTEYIKHLKMPHQTSNNAEYVSFVTYDNRYIREIAEHIARGSKNGEESAQRILAFVQRARRYDGSNERWGDYVKYPIQTLIEGNGDCEDSSILTAALMKSINLDVALLFIHDKENKIAHLAVGINGKFDGSYYIVGTQKYRYIETTNSGWTIGQIPEEYKASNVSVYVID